MPHDMQVYATTINNTWDDPTETKAKVDAATAAQRAGYASAAAAVSTEFQKIDGVPTVTTLSPTTKTAGSAQFTLTVNGTDFDSGSKVRWGSADLATTFVSPVQVTAVVPAANVVGAGTFAVAVRTGNGYLSNAVSFTVT
jgi:IPT/TIG domain